MILASRLIAAIILFSLVAPGPTTYVVYLLRHRQINKEVKYHILSSLQKDELVLLKFPKSQKHPQPVWTESSEFVYRGQMYDVVHSRVDCDTAYYWVWQDDSDTDLLHKLKRLISSANNKGNADNRHCQEILMDLYKSALCINIHASEHCLCMTKNAISFRDNFPLSRRTAPESPPPKES